MNPIRIVSQPAEAASFGEAAPPNAWLLPELEVIVDTGLPDPETIAAILHAIKNWQEPRLLLTHHHQDHIGNLAVLSAHVVEIYAPPAIQYEPAKHLNLDWHEVNKDQPLLGGALQAIVTPGHTQDHLTYLAPDTGYFAGDTVLGEGTPWVGPPEGHLADYLNTLESLMDRQDLGKLWAGHGPEQSSSLNVIQETHAHRLMRETMVAQVLDEGLSDPRAIATRIYNEIEQMNLDGLRFEMAVWTVMGHLERLGK